MTPPAARPGRADVRARCLPRMAAGILEPNQRRARQVTVLPKTTLCRFWRTLTYGKSLPTEVLNRRKVR